MYHVIMNPASRSGKGNQLWQELEAILKAQNAEYTTHFTTQAGDAKRFVEELTGAEGTEPVSLLVMGGDGTLNEAIQGIRNLERTRFYYVPTGSGNDFARDYIEKGRPAERLARLLQNPHEYHTDLGVLQYCDENGKEQKFYFAVSAGIGFDAAVCAEVDKSKWKPRFNKIGLGKLVYLAIALRNLMTIPDVSCKLQLEDEKGNRTEVTRKSFIFAAMMNHKYEGGGFMFAPQADAEDGLLDLCLVENMSKLKILRVIPTAFKGNHVKFKEVYMKKCRSIHIRADEALYIHSDGEVPGKAKELTLSCMKQALTLYL